MTVPDRHALPAYAYLPTPDQPKGGSADLGQPQEDTMSTTSNGHGNYVHADTEPVRGHQPPAVAMSADTERTVMAELADIRGQLADMATKPGRFLTVAMSAFYTMSALTIPVLLVALVIRAVIR